MFLSAAMANVAITFYISFQYISGAYELYTYVHPIGMASVLLIYPSFYQYVLMITGQRQFKLRLFLPGLGMGVASAFFFWGLLSSEGQVYFLTEYRINPEVQSWQLSANIIFRYFNLLLLGRTELKSN